MLEEKIAALIVAVEANTAAVERSIAARAEAIEVVKAASTAAPEATAEKPKKTTKPAAPAAAEAPAPAAAEAPAANPYEGLREIIAEYVGVERPEERKARQGKVKALLVHDRIARPGLTDAEKEKPSLENIAIESIDTFKNQMRLLAEKGDLTTPVEADDSFDI